MKSYPAYATILLEQALFKPLDFGIPPEMIGDVHKGSYVQVPVRGRIRQGYVIAINETTKAPYTHPIHALAQKEELITSELFELGLWMARYYCAPLNYIFKAMLPGSIRSNKEAPTQLFVRCLKSKEELATACSTLHHNHPSQALVLQTLLLSPKGLFLSEILEKTKVSKSPVDTLAKKGLIHLTAIPIDRSPLKDHEYFPTKPKKLNEGQQNALNKINESLNSQSFNTHLLYGVTGSGKTEVYLQAIDTALKKGLNCIMLVPEIALTAQTVERFHSRFGNDIAILHHRLSDSEKSFEWRRIKEGKAKIAIGARSAIFCPMPHLGLIIVDEEHENSYKQTDCTPCYHARDVAVMRGFLQKAIVILGSATPSLESYYNALNGKYKLSILHSRADAASMAKVQIVDMNEEYLKQKSFTNFSSALIDGIQKRVAAGEQTLLFLNRRGYHTTQLCPQCRHVTRCPHCEVALTFHMNDQCLSCHLCGYNLTPPPKQCPQCHSATLKYKGVGTEQIQKAIHAIFPQVRTLRLDADSTKHKGSHEKLLQEFRTGKADILIGTQMIAKGLHFPSVTLVAVLNSDASLNIPDYRASETVFQLITQVAGRSGRGPLAGEVIIQTCIPQNPIIQMAAAQDFTSFYNEEIQIRNLFHYPPFTHLVKLAFTGKESTLIQQEANSLRERLLLKFPKDFHIHPLTAAGHPKVKDHYRFQLLIKGPSVYLINEVVESALLEAPLSKNLKLTIDVDPTSTFF